MIWVRVNDAEKSSQVDHRDQFLCIFVIYFVSTQQGQVISDRVYRIGWESDPPFQQRDQDGAPTGLAVELVREAAQRRGIRLEWVWLPGNSEAALRGNQVDLWPLMTIRPERKRFIHISEPYL